MEEHENNAVSISSKAPGIVFFCQQVLSSTENAIQFARTNNLLVSELLCQCGNQMSLVKKNDCSDGEIWRCRVCYTKKSIRFSSLFKVSTFP